MVSKVDMPFIELERELELVSICHVSLVDTSVVVMPNTNNTAKHDPKVKSKEGKEAKEGKAGKEGK